MPYLRIGRAWCLLLLALLLPALSHAQIVVFPGPGGGGGTGNVIVSGTPTAGQIAAWTDATHIQGISSMGILYDGAHVSTAGAIATSVEYVTTGASNLTRTLPAAASSTALRQFRIVKEDAGAGGLVVAPAGSDTINGTAGALPALTTRWAGWLITESLATGWVASYLPPTATSGGGVALSDTNTWTGANTFTVAPTTVAAGSTGTLGITFVGFTTTGFFADSSGLHFQQGANDHFRISSSFIHLGPNSLSWGATTAGSADTIITRDGAANTLAMKNAGSAQTLRIYGTTTGAKYLILSHDGTNPILNSSSGALKLGSTAVTPATTGTRYLCIDTAGVVASSTSACSGT